MQAVEYLKTHRPVEPLTGSYEIELAAIDHCFDMSMNNLLSHIGTDGDNVKARIEKYCSWRDKIGENISFGSSDPFDVVCQLIIDDGVPSRGHRKNMMSSGKFQCIFKFVCFSYVSSYRFSYNWCCSE